jgi:hypothetical protein
MNKAADELVARLLVYSLQYHSESGAHRRRVESWQHWSDRTGVPPDGLSDAAARITLEQVLASLNDAYGGKGRLPWQKY